MNRQECLKHIVDLIKSGKWDSSSVPLEKLFQTYTDTRQEYQPPYQRDALNYGYEDIGQMGYDEKTK